MVLINIKGVAKRIQIDQIEGRKVSFNGGIIFESAGLVNLLTESQDALFMGATAGNDIVKEIKDNSGGKNITKSVVYDAVASETVDIALEWIMNYYKVPLRREGKCLTRRRYSCGYGDFTLENQKKMHDVLDMKRIDVSINEHFILKPEKSVTAICGIKKL